MTILCFQEFGYLDCIFNMFLPSSYIQMGWSDSPPAKYIVNTSQVSIISNSHSICFWAAPGSSIQSVLLGLMRQMSLKSLLNPMVSSFKKILDDHILPLDTLTDTSSKENLQCPRIEVFVFQSSNYIYIHFNQCL